MHMRGIRVEVSGELSIHICVGPGNRIQVGLQAWQQVILPAEPAHPWLLFYTL